MSYTSWNVNKPYLDSRGLSEDFLKQVFHDVRVAEYSFTLWRSTLTCTCMFFFTFDLVPVRLSGIQA